MTKYYLSNRVYSLLLFFGSFTVCGGQPRKIVNETGQPKIVKTQGTDKYTAVNCGIEDKSGDLWFSTGGEGVYKYDGKSFVNFTVNDGLSSNDIRAVLEDKAGNIWFGTNAGICYYDGKTITRIQIPVPDNKNFYPFNGNTSLNSQPQVWSILQDKTGTIWFGTYKDGVWCYNGKSFTHFLHNDGVINKDSLRLNAISSILEDKLGNIWFTTWFEGICCYDGKSITRYKPNGEVWFACSFEDKNGNIWFGRRDKGVCRYDGKTFANVYEHGAFDSCGVISIKEDKSGNTWFGTESGEITQRELIGGVWCYDGKSFKNFGVKDGLSNYSVFSITIEKSGKLWFGTRGLGLCSYDGKAFTKFAE